MKSPDDPEVAQALRAASVRVQELYDVLQVAHPALRGSLAISGTFVGHGLGVFVANDMTNDQIIANVLTIVAQLRQLQAATAAAVS